MNKETQDALLAIFADPEVKDVLINMYTYTDLLALGMSAPWQTAMDLFTDIPILRTGLHARVFGTGVWVALKVPEDQIAIGLSEPKKARDDCWTDFINITDYTPEFLAKMQRLKVFK